MNLQLILDPLKNLQEAFSINIPPEGKIASIWWKVAMGEVEHFIQWCIHTGTTSNEWKLLKPSGVLIKMSWNGGDHVEYQFRRVGYNKVIAQGSIDVGYLFTSE